MKYWNSYDIFYDTYLNNTYTKIVPVIESFFSDKVYSLEVDKLSTIINCNPGENYKQRSKFRRKEKELFFDIIIDYSYFMNLTNAGQREWIALTFLKDMEVLKKYKPKDFQFDSMKNDFEYFFKKIGWLYR